AMNSSPSEPTLSIGQQPKQSLKNPSHRTCRIGWQTSNPPAPTRLLPRQPLSANHPVRKADLNGCPKTVSRHKNPLRRKRRSSRGWMKMQTRQKPNLPAQRANHNPNLNLISMRAISLPKSPTGSLTPSHNLSRKKRWYRTNPPLPLRKSPIGCLNFSRRVRKANRLLPPQRKHPMSKHQPKPFPIGSPN